MSAGSMARRQVLRMLGLLGLSALLDAGGTAPGAFAVGRRAMALVVGNAAYERMPLRNAIHDARAMSRALEHAGFRVTALENLDWDGSIQALDQFTKEAPAHDVRLFYYAGHGMQVDGRSYLNPVGRPPPEARGLRASAIEVDAIVAALSRLPEGLSILIVDACRDNPFLGAVRRTRGAAPRAGLAGLPAPRGVVLAFSTGPDGVADDGANATNSSFTRHLLRVMQEPGLPIEEAFKRVRRAVHEDTRRGQQPWLSTNLVGEFCFVPNVDGSCGR
jgi:uncharacterized caspase-like protein